MESINASAYSMSVEERIALVKDIWDSVAIELGRFLPA